MLSIDFLKGGLEEMWGKKITPEQKALLETIKGLSEEQMGAIAKLSMDDEQHTINTQTNNVHSGYDQDAWEALGLRKKDGEKSYEFMKREVYPLAKKAKELEEKVKIQASKIEELQKSGVKDTDVQQKLKEQSDLIKSLQGQIVANQQEHLTALNLKEQEFNKLNVKSSIMSELAGVQYKDTIPKNVIDTMLKLEVDKLVNTKYMEVDTTEGKRYNFYEADGQRIMLDPQTGQPKTPGQIIKEQLKDLIDFGKQAPGSGLGNGGANGSQQQGGNKQVSYSINGAISQREAMSKIKAHVANDLKLDPFNPEYQATVDKIWQENEVSKLPM